MVGLSPTLGPGELAAALAALEVRVTSVRVERRDVSLPDYPGGPRPSSVVHVSGDGATGRGELVAFFDEEHTEFATAMQTWFEARRPRPSTSVGGALPGAFTPYARAALEAALIDLGLRQAGLTLYDLTGVRSVELRFVVSLAAVPDPVSLIARMRAAGFTGDLKLDVDPAWNDATLAALAADESIAIFDFKGKGDHSLAQRLAARNERARFEDPPPGFETSLRARLSRDATLIDAPSISEARARGEAVNLKAPRMGGPLRVLDGLQRALGPRAAEPPCLAYLGGMFEVSVGRVQARQIAALYCATSPNDLAPNDPRPLAEARESSPLLVRLDQPGFG